MEIRKVVLTTTIRANGGIHQNLTEGSTHEARFDDKKRVWVAGFSGCQFQLGLSEFRVQES